MKNGSSKPCPGCGEIDSRRPADKVCNTCKAKLKRLDELEERLSGNTDTVIVSFASASYNSYIWSKKRGSGNALQNAFYEIAFTAGKELPAYSKAEYDLLGKRHDVGTHHYHVMEMPRQLAEAIKNTYAMMNKILEGEYEQGKSDGHNLLMRLAQGDLSPNEYLQNTNAG